MFVENKLQTSYSDSQVYYTHPFEPSIVLNDWVGSKIAISCFESKQCLGCRKKVRKLQQGYCFICSKRLACCDLCIVRPSLCHYHLGTCRQPDWGLKHCFTDHVVYLSLTSHLKVGITRLNQLPTRWIDQGAIQASVIAIVPTRKLAGELELGLSRFCRDKTNWRDLLRGKVDSEESFKVKFEQLKQHIKDSPLVDECKTQVTIKEFSPYHFIYPVKTYLSTAKSINLEKTPFFEDYLIGIKGQYLFFETLGGLNMRKYLGYELTIEKAG
jgi:hypothetical protein